MLRHVERRRLCRRLFVELGGGNLLQVGAQLLEQVLEEKGEELTGELEALIAVVVHVIHERRVVLRRDHPSEHLADVHNFWPVVEPDHGHVGEEHVGERVARLLDARTPRPVPVGASDVADLPRDILEGLLLREHFEAARLLQRRRHRLRVQRRRPDELEHLLIGADSHRLQEDDDRHVVGHSVVLDGEAPVLAHEVRLALALVRRRGHRRVDVPLCVAVDDNPILRQLLLNQDHLLLSLHHKVSTRVERALAHPRELLRRPPVEDALLRAEHHRHQPDCDAVVLAPRLRLRARTTVRVLDVHLDRRRVCDVAQPALLRRQLACVPRAHGVVLLLQ